MAYKEREKRNEAAKRYYWRHREENREKHNKRAKIYRTRYKEQRRIYEQEHQQQIRASNLKRKARIKMEVLTHYSNSTTAHCTICNIADIDVLCLDHINNDRKKQNKGLGNVFYYALKRLEYPDGYQTLCANCNLKKEIQRRRNV